MAAGVGVVPRLLAVVAVVVGSASLAHAHARLDSIIVTDGSPTVVASVTVTSGGVWGVQEGVVPGAVATAVFSDSVNAVGWAFLNITTSPTYNNTLQTYGAGYLEAYLTNTRMWQVGRESGVSDRTVTGAFQAPRHPHHPRTCPRPPTLGSLFFF